MTSATPNLDKVLGWMRADGMAMPGLTDPLGAIEIRHAATQLRVSGRTIELIVIPYEQEALVEHRGKLIHEIVSRGAFDGVEELPHRVRVNRDHDRTRTIGKAVRFDPTDRRGLRAEVLISDTPLGAETIVLARDGVLDVSAGFAVRAGGERWPATNLRRLTRLHLDHISLVPDAAYEQAKVITVRTADEPYELSTSTPNMNKVYKWRADDLFASR